MTTLTSIISGYDGIMSFIGMLWVFKSSWITSSFYCIIRILFAGGFSQKCEEKDISYKDTVKDTNPKALHGIIISIIPTTSTTTKFPPWHRPESVCHGTTYHATILKFDTTKFLWSQVGNMTTARTNHGASVVNIEDVKKFCT